jgi:hypothetical protein
MMRVPICGVVESFFERRDERCVVLVVCEEVGVCERYSANGKTATLHRDLHNQYSDLHGHEASGPRK